MAGLQQQKSPPRHPAEEAASGGRQAHIPCLISAERIDRRVRELARDISADYAEAEPVLVGVLHGAYVFMADLVRHMTIPIQCGFVMVSSYGDETVSSGKIELHLDLVHSVDGRHVLLIEDLVDTGLSTAWLMEHLGKKNPASVRLCSLLDKASRRRIPVTIDYLGFDIPDRFVVGYGIDCAGRYRELPYVGYVPPDEQP